jgi:hypothetical protein
LSLAYKNSQSKTYWNFECSNCGKIFTAREDAVKRGSYKGCGCLRHNPPKNKRHDEATAKTPLYKRWALIKSRCNESNDTHRDVYFSRGIKVCDEWLVYENFRDWALNNGFQKNLTIDRIDNSKGYLPDNCRWITAKEQGRNKRNNIIIEFNGQRLCLSAWAEKYGLNRYTLKGRIEREWGIEKALTTPAAHKSRQGLWKWDCPEEIYQRLETKR